MSGVRDRTKNDYHNRAFAARAEAMGLVVERDERRGWAHTSAGPALAGQIKALQIDESAFALSRDYLAAGSTTKQTTRMRRWTCGCTLVRAAVEVVATCGKCGRPFARR
jgi:hypothetical protein